MKKLQHKIFLGDKVFFLRYLEKNRSKYDSITYEDLDLKNVVVFNKWDDSLVLSIIVGFDGKKETMDLIENILDINYSNGVETWVVDSEFSIKLKNGKFSSSGEKLLKKLEKEHVIFDNITELNPKNKNLAIKFIMDLLNKNNKKINSYCSELFLEKVGYDISSIISEVENISGVDSEEIIPEHIDLVFSNNNSVDFSEFYSSMSNGSVIKCYEQMMILISRGVNENAIMDLLLKRYRTIVMMAYFYFVEKRGDKTIAIVMDGKYTNCNLPQDILGKKEDKDKLNYFALKGILMFLESAKITVNSPVNKIYNNYAKLVDLLYDVRIGRNVNQALLESAVISCSNRL